MKNLLPKLIFGFAFAFLGGCATTRTAVHSNWLEQPSHRIAVLPFNGEEPFGEELADALVTELMSARFPVMERARLMQILKEQTLQHTGAVDPLTLAQTGRLAGVDFVVLGSVTTRPVVPVFEWLLGEGKTVMQIDSVNIRWVNVQSGQVMASSYFRNSHGASLETIAKKIAKSLDQKIQSIARIQEVDGEVRVTKESHAAYAYKTFK